LDWGVNIGDLWGQQANDGRRGRGGARRKAKAKQERG
jgi:hypothetical protein